MTLSNIETGLTRAESTGESGLFRFTLLPIGQYTLAVKAALFAPCTQGPINIRVSQTARVTVQLQLASVAQSVTVAEDANPVDTATNTLGRTINGREILDLPLNGRNFSQLGLLQTGVAPVSPGVFTQGGSMRSGQAYSVNGQSPNRTTTCWTARRT